MASAEIPIRQFSAMTPDCPLRRYFRLRYSVKSQKVVAFNLCDKGGRGPRLADQALSGRDSSGGQPSPLLCDGASEAQLRGVQPGLDAPGGWHRAATELRAAQTLFGGAGLSILRLRKRALPSNQPMRMRACMAVAWKGTAGLIALSVCTHIFTGRSASICLASCSRHRSTTLDDYYYVERRRLRCARAAQLTQPIPSPSEVSRARAQHPPTSHPRPRR